MQRDSPIQLQQQRRPKSITWRSTSFYNVRLTRHTGLTHIRWDGLLGNHQGGTWTLCDERAIRKHSFGCIDVCAPFGEIGIGHCWGCAVDILAAPSLVMNKTLTTSLLTLGPYVSASSMCSPPCKPRSVRNSVQPCIDWESLLSKRVALNLTFVSLR